MLLLLLLRGRCIPWYIPAACRLDIGWWQFQPAEQQGRHGGSMRDQLAQIEPHQPRTDGQGLGFGEPTHCYRAILLQQRPCQISHSHM
jgi:hypothetical protein